MVLCDYGHWNSIHPPKLHTFQITMALLSLHRVLHSERHSLYARFPHLFGALHALSRDLVRHDTRSHKFSILRHYTNGVCHLNRDVGIRLRTNLGTMGYDIRVGTVDDRHRPCRVGYDIAVFPTVRISPHYSLPSTSSHLALSTA
jgi:hypothetical protein